MLNRKSILGLIILALTITTLIIFWPNANLQKVATDDGYLGSESCRECHERFYQLWAPSHHGLAMQKVTPELLINDSIVNSDTFQIEGSIFQTVVKKGKLYLTEEYQGVKNEYHSSYVSGGKYIYYFLIPLERGKLQVMPLAYDLRAKEWYNNPQSGVRHFEAGDEDEALNWKSSMYTFNSNCLACHVSQVDRGFDLATNSYHTSWKEDGINCEACHGPSKEHSRVFTEARDGEMPKESHLIMTTDMDNERNNSACLNCHAQMNPLTESFMPGERFYDHFTMTALEDPDSYSDGRDLGENFTMITWEQSQCNINKDFACMDCHTSSGRYRFADPKIANNACLPCHTERVNNPDPHTHHEGGEFGIKCVDCHMPITQFARMDRSDHSNKPPMPSASIEFGSPNACNICHDDQSAEWADKHVRSWHKDDYQKPYLEKARLVNQARAGNWDNLDTMLGYINNNPKDVVYLASLIRLLENYRGDEKWNTLLNATKNESPLVRSVAIHGLAYYASNGTKEAIIRCVNDEYRVVRIEGAYAAHRQPQGFFSKDELQLLTSATKEYENSIKARPDSWSSHFNLGNYYSEKGTFELATEAYQTSLKISDEQVATYVNLGMNYAYMQNYALAKDQFDKALSLEPENEIVLTNYALLMIELKNYGQAEKLYRKIYEINSNSGQAAYNLAIMTSEKDKNEAVDWSRKAHNIEPENISYHYTYAFYLFQNNALDDALITLNSLIKTKPNYVDAYLMKAQVYNNKKQPEKALAILKEASQIKGLSAEETQQINYLLGQMNK